MKISRIINLALLLFISFVYPQALKKDFPSEKQIDVIENLGGDPKGLVFQGVIADELPSEFVVRLPDEEFDRVKYGAIDEEFKTVR